MKVKFFIFTGLFILIGMISFGSASFEIGNQSHSIQENYQIGQNINGWINISFDSEAVSSIFSDNLGNFQTLEEFLNSSKNSGYNFSCGSSGCVDNYIEIEDFEEKSFQLEKGKEAIIGFKFTGILDKIDSAEFEIISNSENSCESQLEIDFGDDGRVNYGNTKLSSEVCESRESKSCYDESENPREVSLNYNPYCQIFNLSSAPGFELGLWIKSVQPGDKEIKFELYDRYEIPQAECSLNNAEITENGDYVYCDIDHFVPEKGQYYVCVYAEDSGTGEYETKGYYSSNSSKVCGFWDYPSQAEGKTNAYAISVKPRKFDNFGTLKINESSVSEGFSNLIEINLYDRYGSLDCSSGCYFPMKFISNTNQTISFRNLNVGYSDNLGPGEDSTFYNLEKEGYLISSEFQKLYLNNFSVPENLEESYKVYFEGQEILKNNIGLKDFGVSLKISNYEKAVEGLNIEFDIEAYINDSIREYRMFVEGLEKSSRYPSFAHTFNGSGNKIITVEVENIAGEIFSEEKEIVVYPIEQEFGSLIEEKRQKLTSIEENLMVISPAVETRINSELNLDESRNALSNLESSFELAQTKEDYLDLVPLLESINLPSSVSSSTSHDSLLLLEEYSIEFDPLKEKPKAYDDEQEVIDYALFWTVQNLDLKYNYEDISSFDSQGSETNSWRLINLKINEENSFSEDYYLYVKKNSGLEVVDSGVEEENGYFILELDDNSNIKILSDSKREIEKLPVFISPEMSDLEFSVGEIEEYDKSKNRIIMILVIFIVIFAGMVAYYFIGKWYDEKYEKKLFPNRNDVFNLINYIARSKKNGVPESKIRKNLLNSKWSSEQVRYILRKYLGKNTGMYAFFKRKVKAERKLAREEDRKMKIQKTVKKSSSISKKNSLNFREIWKIIIFSVITLGIYSIVWVFKTSKELKRLDKNAPSLKLIWASLIVGIIGAILMVIAQFLGVMGFVTGSFGLAGVILILSVLAYIASGVLTIILYWKYSTAHSNVTGFSKIGLFLLFLFVWPAGMIVSQIYLNKVAKKLQKT